MHWKRRTFSRAHPVALPILCNHSYVVICFYVETLEGELRCSFLLRPLCTPLQTWRACAAAGLFGCDAAGKATGSAILQQLCLCTSCTVPLTDWKHLHEACRRLPVMPHQGQSL